MNTSVLTIAITTAISGLGMAHASTPFAMEHLSQGYMLAAADKASEGKCGEGKCGGAKTASKNDGKPVTVQAKKAKKDAAKAKDGKCGEGKCGGSK